MLSNFIELFKEMKTLPGLRFKDDEQIFWLYSTLPETWANIIVLKAEDVSLDRLRDEMAELAACAGSFKVYCYPNSNLKAQEF